MRDRAQRVRDEGPLDDVSMIRSYGAAGRVAARLEISSGGLLRRGRDAGVDVMGDGRLVAYAGGVGRRELEPPPGGDEFDAVRFELT